MKFNLIDKIESLDERRIVASKSVSLAEEYLADHFPTFPVLPGVMMLEALTQAAGWLLHHRMQFGKSMAILREARNIRYGQFVAPGSVLTVEVDFLKATDTGGATFKATSTVNGEQAISGRVELAYFNLGDREPDLAWLDDKLKKQTQDRWNVLLTHSPIGTNVPIAI